MDSEQAKKSSVCDLEVGKTFGSDNAPSEMSWNDNVAQERPVRSRYAALVNFKAVAEEW